MNAVAPPELRAATRRGATAPAEAEQAGIRIEFDDSPDEAAPLHGGLAGAGTEAADPPAGPEPGTQASGATMHGPDTGARPGAEAPAGEMHSRAGDGAGRGQNPCPAHAAGPGPAIPAQLAAIEVLLSVEVGSRKVPLRELMHIEPGQIFALDRMTTEPVTILANGRPFARGEIVALGERFGIRLLDLLSGGEG